MGRQLRGSSLLSIFAHLAKPEHETLWRVLAPKRDVNQKSVLTESGRNHLTGKWCSLLENQQK
jgi:hypothetical protein